MTIFIFSNSNISLKYKSAKIVTIMATIFYLQEDGFQWKKSSNNKREISRYAYYPYLWRGIFVIV
jgi:hypothetical protein